MIRDVPLTGIFVNDQAAALEFYAGKLELELVRD
jgi:catechol 2,3-dioxygenase-like lactoylglutathione lyase family enzyme